MAFWAKSTLQPYAKHNNINRLTAHVRSQVQSTPDKSVRKVSELLPLRILAVEPFFYRPMGSDCRQNLVPGIVRRHFYPAEISRFRTDAGSPCNVRKAGNYSPQDRDASTTATSLFASLVAISFAVNPSESRSPSSAP